VRQSCPAQLPAKTRPDSALGEDLARRDQAGDHRTGTEFLPILIHAGTAGSGSVPRKRGVTCRFAGNTKPAQLGDPGKINTRTTWTKRYCPAPDGTLAKMTVLAHGSPHAGQTGWQHLRHPRSPAMTGLLLTGRSHHSTAIQMGHNWLGQRSPAAGRARRAGIARPARRPRTAPVAGLMRRASSCKHRRPGTPGPAPPAAHDAIARTAVDAA
jgi:hypothetical protein